MLDNVIEFPNLKAKIRDLKVEIFDKSREIDRIQALIDPHRMKIQEVYTEITQLNQSLAAMEAELAASAEIPQPETIH